MFCKTIKNQPISKEKIDFNSLQEEIYENLLSEFISPIEREDIFILQKRLEEEFLMICSFSLFNKSNFFDFSSIEILFKGNVAVLDKLEKVRGFVKTDEAAELAEDARIELAQATEVVATYGKMLKAIKETFESVINMDSNTNINRLTMWNIVLVIPTVIVGYYGMNMQLPFAEHPRAAVSIFIAIMVLLVGFAMFGAIKKRIIQ
jgi:hypothetical protein